VECYVTKPVNCHDEAVAQVWIACITRSAGVRRIRVAFCEAHLAAYDALPQAERDSFAEDHGLNGR
jgi:hypothetical protein